MSLHLIDSQVSPTLFRLILHALAILPLPQFLGNADPLPARGVLCAPLHMKCSPYTYLTPLATQLQLISDKPEFFCEKALLPILPIPQPSILYHSTIYLFSIELSSFLIGSDHPLPSVDYKIWVNRTVAPFAYQGIHSTVPSIWDKTVLVSLNCCNRIQWTEWLINNKYSFLIVLEVRSLRLRYWRFDI